MELGGKPTLADMEGKNCGMEKRKISYLNDNRERQRGMLTGLRLD